MFYNTGIATYIWIVTKDKAVERTGKVQLIDASKCSVKRRKPLGNKRNEFTDECIKLIAQAYEEFADGVFNDEEHGLEVEVKIKDNEDFKYTGRTVFQHPAWDKVPQHCPRDNVLVHSVSICALRPARWALGTRAFAARTPRGQPDEPPPAATRPGGGEAPGARSPDPRWPP